MDRISDNKKCMASLAVFRSLYDKEKDLYSVIASFSKQLIISQRLNGFELQEFCSKFKDEYGFDLPTAVIKTSLKRLNFLKIEHTYYLLTECLDNLDIDNVSQLETESTQRNQEILDALVKYVESEEGTVLSENQKQILYNSFCSFVIDETTDVEYKNDISSFVLLKSTDATFIKQLNDIRLGLVIFIGLCYNTNFDKIDGIDSKLNIYLETEILFHRAGYNGQLFKTLYKEFYNLVQEINRKAHKTLISLYYFAETDKDIRDYFAIAEDIVRGKKPLDPSKTAMKYIVTNCHYPSDVKTMESEFFQDLLSEGIIMDRQENYYDKQNYELNIEQDSFIIPDSFTNEDVYNKLKLLNYVNIKRGGKSQNVFRNVGHILLTGNSLTFKIAFDDRIRKSGNVPLATGLDFLTNRFWLITNKGFSKTLELTSLNILTKAQIVMSASINESISAKYKLLMKEEQEGHFDLDKQKAALAGLHKHSINPEDLNSINQETYLNFLKTDDITTYLAEQELERQHKESELSKLQTTAEKNENLAHKAIDVLTENENIKLREIHKKELASYKERKELWVKKQIRKKVQKSIFVIVGYVSIITVVCILSVCQLGAIMSIIATLLFAIIPFVRPVWNHRIVIDSISFIFCKRVYQLEIEKLEAEYKKIESRPKLIVVTKEDVAAKLNGK